jgi:hypothetical protein
LDRPPEGNFYEAANQTHCKYSSSEYSRRAQGVEGGIMAEIKELGRLIIIAFVSAILLSSVATRTVFAQAGSTGGTIGKQDKSTSGSQELPSLPKPSPKRAARGEGVRPKIRSRASITGRWHWDIKCPTANFVGILNIVQSGDTFAGEFGHTNFWDNGTVSNGRVSGDTVTFDREYYGTDHVVLHLSGSVMQGPHDNATYGHCFIHSTKF